MLPCLGSFAEGKGEGTRKARVHVASGASGEIPLLWEDVLSAATRVVSAANKALAADLESVQV